MIVCTFNDGRRCRQFSSEDDNFDWRSELCGISKRMRKKRNILYTTQYCRDSYILFEERGFLLPDGRSEYYGESFIPFTRKYNKP